MIYVVVAIIGSAIAWAPSILVHSIFKCDFGAIGLILIFLLMPIFSVLALWTARRVAPGRYSTIKLAFAIIIAMWWLGPVALMTAVTAEGSGFSKPLGLSDAVVMLIPGTVILAGSYTGDIIPLIPSTLGILLLSRSSAFRKSP